MTHICVGKLTLIVSDNGLSPDRRQAIIWTNAGLLSIGPLRTNFSENVIKIQQFSLKKMHVKMSSAKWRPSCLGLNVLTVHSDTLNRKKTAFTDCLKPSRWQAIYYSGIKIPRPIQNITRKTIEAEQIWVHWSISDLVIITLSINVHIDIILTGDKRDQHLHAQMNESMHTVFTTFCGFLG